MTKLVSLLWCEKSVPSHKLLGLCLPDEFTRKLFDGLGMTIDGSLERILMESSGEADGSITAETQEKD